MRSELNRECHDLFEPIPQIGTDAVAKQRLNTLAKADTDHTRDHGHLGSNTDTSHGHITEGSQLTIHNDLGNAHQQRTKGSRIILTERNQHILQLKYLPLHVTMSSSFIWR